MGFLDKLLGYRRRPRNRRRIEVRVARPFNGETVFYFVPVVCNEDRIADAEKRLATVKAGGLCIGYETSRLCWGELRVYRNPIYQKDRDWMERAVTRVIQICFM